MSGILTKGSDVLFSGRLWGALKFNATSPGFGKGVSIPYNASLTSFTDGVGNDVPISLSVITRGVSGNNGNLPFLGKGISSSSTEIFFQIHDSGIYAQLSNGMQNSDLIGRFSSWLQGEKIDSLSHYIITYDGSKLDTGIKIYKNKVERSTSSYSSGAYTGQSDNYQTIYCMRPSEVGGNNLIHQVSSWKLFDKVLTETERNQLFDTENFAKVASGNLVIDYDFREKQGTVLNDRSGNALNGTISTLDADFFWCNPYTETSI